MADRIVIINQGRIVGDGTLAELQARTQRVERARLIVAAERKMVEPELKKLPQVQHVRCTRSDEGAAYFEVDATVGSQLTRNLAKLIQQQGWQVEGLTSRPPSLEETFLALTEPQES